jgi:hypothetical protein
MTCDTLAAGLGRGKSSWDMAGEDSREADPKSTAVKATRTLNM